MAEFKAIKAEELQRVWELEKSRIVDKIRRQARQNVIPDQVEGIKVSDSALEEDLGTPVVDPIVFGGIQVSNNVRAFLSLPLRYKLSPKMSRLNHQVQTECRGTRQRWKIRDKNQHGPEDPEAYRRRKEKENDDRQPCQGNIVDFSQTRVTSLLCNKYIHMPKPVSEREEVAIHSEMIDLLDTWDLHSRRKVKGYDWQKTVSQGLNNCGWMSHKDS